MITGLLWVGPVFEHLTEKFIRSLYGFGDKQEAKPKYDPAESMQYPCEMEEDKIYTENFFYCINHEDGGDSGDENSSNYGR